MIQFCSAYEHRMHSIGQLAHYQTRTGTHIVRLNVFAFVLYHVASTYLCVCLSVACAMFVRFLQYIPDGRRAKESARMKQYKKFRSAKATSSITM